MEFTTAIDLIEVGVITITAIYAVIKAHMFVNQAQTTIDHLDQTLDRVIHRLENMSDRQLRQGNRITKLEAVIEYMNPKLGVGDTEQTEDPEDERT